MLLAGSSGCTVLRRQSAVAVLLGTAGSNPAEGMDICLLCVLCVVR